MIMQKDTVPSGYYIKQEPWKTVKPRVKRDGGPGPAACALPSTIGSNNHDFTKTKSPAYSFGMRWKDLNTAATPGPANYNTSNISRHGKFSSPTARLIGRKRITGDDTSPGPAAYYSDLHTISSAVFGSRQPGPLPTSYLNKNAKQQTGQRILVLHPISAGNRPSSPERDLGPYSSGDNRY